ncbi:MAG: hypothetical protein ACK56I_25080, partial [bacterium]
MQIQAPATVHSLLSGAEDPGHAEVGGAKPGLLERASEPSWMAWASERPPWMAWASGRATLGGL